MSRRLFTAALAVTALFLAKPAAKARGGEFYYVMIFGSQSHPKKLKYTHTWATFVRAVGEGPDLNSYALQVHTISWLPQTLEVKVLRPWPEPGVNLELEPTLNAMYANGENVTMWGPFMIQKLVYERSLRIWDLARSGRPQYRAISNARDMLISDCIHAVAAVDPVFGRNHYPLIRIGKPASRYLARQIMTRSVYDQSLNDNAWLVPRLGLNRYPIEVIPPQRIPRRNCVLCRIPE